MGYKELLKRLGITILIGIMWSTIFITIFFLLGSKLDTFLKNESLKGPVDSKLLIPRIIALLVIIIFISYSLERRILDNSKRREIENQYQQLFSKMPIGFYVVEPDFNENMEIIDLRVIIRNPYYGESCPIRNSKIEGKTWFQIFCLHNTDIDVIRRVLETGISEQFKSYNPICKQYYLANAFIFKPNEVGVAFDNITKSVIE
jgi:PAS domain-containing protein